MDTLLVGQSANSNPDQNMKMTIAMGLVRSKILQMPTADVQPPPPPALPPPPFPSSLPSQSDALKWKRKAKERKEEIIKLREDLREAEDTMQCDLFPQSAACKCYFFDDLGKVRSNLDSSERRFNDVLRRRFFRQARLKEKRKRNNNSTHQRFSSDYYIEDERDQLRASVDFLVGLCETVSPATIESCSFTNWSHEAVDFILSALKNMASKGKNTESTEGIVRRLIVRLVRKMCTAIQGEEINQFDIDIQYNVQHFLRKLGSEPYVGQRVILSVAERISVLAENMLFMDPFDESFPNIHGSMYVMMQLIEFMVLDYLPSWSTVEGFDTRLFEEWVSSILHARKTLEVLESRNGLYVTYMDRLIGEVAQKVVQGKVLQKLSSDVLRELFR